MNPLVHPAHVHLAPVLADKGLDNCHPAAKAVEAVVEHVRVQLVHSCGQAVGDKQ